MDRAATVATWVNIVLFGGLAIMCLRVARRLWRAGRDLPSVARYRTRTMALGATGLALAGLPGLVPGESRPAAVQIASLLLPPISAALFVVGFRPPAWLRAVWRRPDHIAVRRLELELIRAEDRDCIIGPVLPHAARLVGGDDAVFLGNRENGDAADGLAVLREVKNDPQLRTIPTVVLSSSDRPEDIATAYELGGNSFVTKPATASGFREGLRQLGEYWAGLASLPETAL